MKKIVQRILVILSALTLLLACDKKQLGNGQREPLSPPSPPNEPTPPLPSITSYSITDYCERKITINGANFDTDIAKDSVFFGNLKGIVDSATSTQLFAEYPAASGPLLGQIKVFSNGLVTTINESVVIPRPSISSFSPATAGPGTLITIIGYNFTTDTVKQSVFFNDIKAQVVAATQNVLTVRVPVDAASGTIRLNSRCQMATANTPFTFSNKGIVYASGNAGVLYAFDIASGSPVWQATVHSGFFSGPAYDNGIVYIGSSDVNVLSNNYMYALNATNGRQIWKFNAGPYDGIPLIHEGVLYCAGYDRKLLALDAATGQKKWEFLGEDYFTGGSPTYHDGKLYIRNDDGYFYCVDAAAGTLVWRKMIWPGGNPSVVNGIVYTAGSGIFYAMDAITGNTVWTLSMPYLSGSSPTVVDNVVYMAAENHQIYALDAASGAIIWRKEASWWVSSALIVSNNILYVHSGDGVLEALDAATGSKIWSKPLPSSDLSGACPVVANGIVFVGDDNGRLNALDALNGTTIWAANTGGYAMISSACVVDENGLVYHAGDSGEQP